MSDRDLEDAIEYFYVQGFMDELTSDKRYYVDILVRFAAAELNIKLD